MCIFPSIFLFFFVSSYTESGIRTHNLLTEKCKRNRYCYDAVKALLDRMIQLGGVIYKNADVSSGIWIAQEFEFGQGGLKVFATAAQPRRFVFILPRPGVAVAVQVLCDGLDHVATRVDVDRPEKARRDVVMHLY